MATPIEATDGKVGVISDILFDASNWTLRWFVIDTGSWLSSRKILIHPTALEPPDRQAPAFPAALTRVQVEASPDIRTDAPVSLQMEQQLNAYYGYGAAWTEGGYGLPGDMAFSPSGLHGMMAAPAGDPHLRSIAELTGYYIHALDGDIGHLEDFLVDDESWKIEYAVVDTKNWGFSKNVLVSPTDIKEINWNRRNIHLELTCYKIKCSPSWTEPDWSERAVRGQKKRFPWRPLRRLSNPATGLSRTIALSGQHRRGCVPQLNHPYIGVGGIIAENAQ